MTTKKFYFLSLGVVLAASGYPVYMGIVILTELFRDGGVEVSSYPQYVIPYTPMCLAVLLTVALLPLIVKSCKGFALPAASLLGVGLFLTAELCFEQITVFEGVGQYSLEGWQAFSCVAIPQVMERIGNPLGTQYSPAFKVHFYCIALLIVVSVIGVIHGFSTMLRDKSNRKKAPLITQLIAVVVFIGLCILACFTAFFRTGALTVSPLSAFLMTVFFIVFGVTAGVYSGTLLYGRGRLFSVVLPSVATLLTTTVMYVGELFLTGGMLFKFGNGFFFEPLGILPFALPDILTILLSGAATCAILNAIQPKITAEEESV